MQRRLVAIRNSRRPCCCCRSALRASARCIRTVGVRMRRDADDRRDATARVRCRRKRASRGQMLELVPRDAHSAGGGYAGGATWPSRAGARPVRATRGSFCYLRDVGKRRSWSTATSRPVSSRWLQAIFSGASGVQRPAAWLRDHTRDRVSAEDESNCADEHHQRGDAAHNRNHELPEGRAGERRSPRMKPASAIYS